MPVLLALVASGFLLLGLFGLSSASAESSGNRTGGGVSPKAKAPPERIHTLSLKKCAPGDRHSFKSHKKWTKRLVGAKGIPAKAKRRHAHYVRCPKGPNHRKIMKARWKKVKNSIVEPLPANHDLWVRIGRCEQPGPGYKGVNWSFSGATYQGGLGIWYGNWDSLKPRGYPSDAGVATWREQMEVANRLAANYGFSAWGCY